MNFVNVVLYLCQNNHIIPISVIVVLSIIYALKISPTVVVISSVLLVGITTNNIILSVLSIFIIVVIESSAENYAADTNIRRNIYSSVKYFVRFMYRRIRANIWIEPNIISGLSAILSVVAVYTAYIYSTPHYGVALFLSTCLLDFYDGYVAEYYCRSRKRYSIDGIVDRAVEGMMIIFYWILYDIDILLVVFCGGYIINLLYMLKLNKYNIAQVRPYIILLFIYPALHNYVIAIIILYVPYLVSLFQKKYPLIAA